MRWAVKAGLACLEDFFPVITGTEPACTGLDSLVCRDIDVC